MQINIYLRFLLIIFAFFCSHICYSTNNTYSRRNVQGKAKETLEFVNSSDIKTVTIHKLGWELSEPAIELNSIDKLLISFDDLSENPGTYSYTLTHCDSKWNPSPIFYYDFMTGFEVNEVKDYSYSTGTIFNYMHCRIEIPNSDIKPKISGNYIISIFNTYEPDEILIQRRFIVFESLLKVEAKVQQPPVGDKRNTGQQLELKINTTGIRVTDPHGEIRVIACQNYLFQGCFSSIKPVHIKGNELDYSHPDALIFDGGNEFRIFDTKNLRYLGQGLQSIDYYGGEFHVQLKSDENRGRLKYSRYSDLNGRYVVNLERSQQSHLEADYSWIYFSLKSPIEADAGKSVYLFGELTGWQLSPENRMIYNYERRAYEIRLLLKQGAYSYRYVLADDSSGQVDITHFEGSHYDTENTYMVLVYYKPLGARYERIVGNQRINSQNQ